jgi:hypothetical protein
MTQFEHKFFFFASRVLLLTPAVIPFLFSWFMSWWLWTQLSMIIGSAIPAFWCSFVLTNGWCDSLYERLVGEPRSQYRDPKNAKADDEN